MGCCASSTSTEPSAPVETKATKTPSVSQEQPVNKTIPVPKATTTPAATKKLKAMSTPVVAAKTKPAAVMAAPAPGVKHVRAAYKGKGWAPPAKEWESNKKEAGNKIRTEIEDEWDEDGNLKRTTTKHITTPDWKKTTETTVEIIPAAEAEKMGLGKQ